MSPTVLIVDDDESQRVSTKTTILAAAKTVGEHYDTVEAASVEEALEYFDKTAHLPCLVILDMLLPKKRFGPDPEFSNYAGYELLRSVSEKHPQVWWLVASAQQPLNQIIVEDEGKPLLNAVTGYSNVIGIWFKTKEAELERIVEQFFAFESQARKRQRPGRHAGTGSVREPLEGEIFSATSSASLNIYSKVLMLATGANPNPVLVIGERGTGKELISILFHKMSSDIVSSKRIPYQKIDGETIEYDELFEQLEKIGAGTLYIENIDKMSKVLQDDLSRNLVELENFPARVVYGIARHHSLFSPSTISDDIYLSSLILPLPSLRERTDELVDLSKVFLELYNSRRNTSKRLVQEERVEQWLQACQWPNNLDDLRLLIEQAATLTASPAIGYKDIEEAARQRKLVD